MDWGTVFFYIIMLHLLVGFGYAFYKIEFGGRKSGQNTEESNSQQHQNND